MSLKELSDDLGEDSEEDEYEDNGSFEESDDVSVSTSSKRKVYRVAGRLDGHVIALLVRLSYHIEAKSCPCVFVFGHDNTSDATMT